MQFFLQAKILGTEEFVRSGQGSAGAAGRAHYLTLLSEALPRALLSTLGLAKELLGTSGGAQFMVVVPGEFIPAANDFLTECAGKLRAISGGSLRMIWSATENLGDWSIVRKRLLEPLDKLKNTPAAGGFEVEVPRAVAFDFAEEFFARFATARAVGWNSASDSLIVLDEGSPLWPLSQEPGLDTIQAAVHFAHQDDSELPAMPEHLAARAVGRKAWGVLRGDVDNFGARLRRAQTIEEHIQLSVFFQQFFAGELQVACSMGEFFRKVSILYTGGDDFAVYGAWDALIPLAREIQRLFHKSVEEFLKDFPGPEAKTLSMAVELAPSPGASLTSVYREAGRKLDTAKSLGKDSIAVLGKTLEWKQLTEATELKAIMQRLVEEFGCSPEFLGQLGGFYRETDSTQPLRLNRAKADRFDRPWRFYRRLSRVLESPVRERDFQKVKATLLGEFIGKNQAHVKLRPSGRVALEWARFLEEAEQ